MIGRFDHVALSFVSIGIVAIVDCSSLSESRNDCAALEIASVRGAADPELRAIDNVALRASMASVLLGIMNNSEYA
jgi:hypothetical protein